MFVDTLYKRTFGNGGRRVLSLVIFFMMFAPVFIRHAKACVVTEVKLYVRRKSTDPWGTSATICLGETAYFKAECQVGDDLDGRPIKWKFTYGDGSSETKWTDDEDSGPTSGGSYSKTPDHSYSSGNTNDDKYYEVEVEVQRVDPDTGSPITDWESDTCKVTVVTVSDVKYQEGSEWISNDLCVTKGTTVTFKAIPLPSDATWPSEQPVWSGTSGASGTGETTSVTFNDLGAWTITAACCSSEKTRWIYVQEVKFVEDTSQSYGFDDWTDVAKPYKSVKNGGSDTAKAEIVTDPVDSVYFKSLTESNVTVSPSQASSSPQTLTFSGLAIGESEIQARAGSIDGTYLAGIGVKVYQNQDNLKIKIITIQEDSSSTAYLPTFMTGLETYLNEEIFNQCVTEFTVAPGFNLTVVNYDLDGNGKLNYPADQEAQAIIDAAKDTSYDYNVFVVHDIQEYRGFGEEPGRYSWVEYNTSQHTVAHELGHNVGGLGHVSVDNENLMSDPDTVGSRLREGQWDDCNPRQTVE